MNIYTYVHNDPLNWVDPLGLCEGDQQPSYPGEDCNVTVTGPGGPVGGGGRGGGVLLRGFPWLAKRLERLEEPYYLTDIDCSGTVGKVIRGTGNLAVDVGGAGVAVGGTGVAIGTALGIGGAVTGNVPAAGLGAIITGASAPIATGGALRQGGGALVAFAGGESSRSLVKNGSGAIINRLPLPSWAKTPLKQGAKYLSQYVPDVRTCRTGKK